MLATLTDEPFDSPEWIFELKYDGYRIVTHLQKGKATLYTRNSKDYSARFYPITIELKKWKLNAVIDGEVVVLNEKGMSEFNRLQNWNTDADGPLYYYVFDILYHNGKSQMDKPLTERRALLKSILPKSNAIRFSDDLPAKGKKLFTMARKMKLEGIIAKKADSIYQPGARSDTWLKIKASIREEAIICGYTKNEGGKIFSSLVLGAYKGKELVFIGQVGTGFTYKDLKDIMAQMKPYLTDKCPFKEIPDLKSSGRWGRRKVDFVQWCKPVLVCQIQYLEKTVKGDLRHQSFLGMREDKPAKEVKV